MPTPQDTALIREAIESGIREHFSQARSQIPAFVHKYYYYPGCWQTNRHALGFDLLRAPLNLLWAPTYLLLLLLLWIAEKAGFKYAQAISYKLPGGMTTKVQRYINEQTKDELVRKKDLRECISKKLAALPELAVAEAHSDEIEEELNRILDDALEQLMLTRTASADISNTIATTALGALLFKKFTPGGIGIGLILAAIWVKERAIDNFIFGKTLGNIYYAIFPPVPTIVEQSLSIGSVMVILAIIASFSGLITDPIQTFFGLHQRRLRKMLNHMEEDLLNKSKSNFKPLDPYIARLLELVDTIRAPIGL